MHVKKGDKIKIQYTGKLETGEVFDSSEGRDPLEFTVGEGRLIKGMEEGVLGMEVGQEKTIILPPTEAYGEQIPQLTQQVQKQSLPEKIRNDITLGTMLRLQDQTGRIVTARITAIHQDTITLDLNHPLAGKILHFTIKLEAIA